MLKFDKRRRDARREKSFGGEDRSKKDLEDR
jgi:hypothetical protein